MKAQVESHALRALNKRQTLVKKFEKVNSKMPSPASGGTRFGPQKVKFMQVKCQTDTKRTKVTEVFQKSWWNHLRSAPKSFCWFISTKRKAIAKFGSRRELWKIVVMDFEVFCIDRRSLTPESFEQFWRAFLHISCKSENFVIIACKSILPPSLMAELDRFVKLTCSEVNVAE